MPVSRATQAYLLSVVVLVIIAMPLVAFVAFRSSPGSPTASAQVANYSQYPCEDVDVSDDGKVDSADVALVRADFGKTGDVLKTDITKNGRVDAQDIGIVRKDFGRTCFTVPGIPIAECSFNPFAVAQGDTLNVTMAGFFQEPHKVWTLTPFGTSGQLLGVVGGSGGVITIPESLQTGSYKIAVEYGANFPGKNITCSGVLDVTGSKASCTFDPKTITPAQKLSVAINGFADGAHTVRIVDTTFGSFLDIGTVSAPSGLVSIPNQAANSALNWEVRVETGNGPPDVTCAGLLKINPV